MLASRNMASESFNHVIFTLLECESEDPLCKALRHHAIDTMSGLLSLSDDDIKNLVYFDKDGSTKHLNMGSSRLLKCFMSFVSYKEAYGNPISDSWFDVTHEEFQGYRTSPEYISFRNSPEYIAFLESKPSTITAYKPSDLDVRNNNASIISNKSNDSPEPIKSLLSNLIPLPTIDPRPHSDVNNSKVSSHFLSVDCSQTINLSENNNQYKDNVMKEINKVLHYVFLDISHRVPSHTLSDTPFDSVKKDWNLLDDQKELASNKETLLLICDQLRLLCNQFHKRGFFSSNVCTAFVDDLEYVASLTDDFSQ